MHLERSGDADWTDTRHRDSRGRAFGPGDSKRPLQAVGDAWRHQGVDGPNRALGDDGAGRSEQNRACWHPASCVAGPTSRAIVRNKAGKQTEFGLAYLISPLGGGYVFGQRIEANADERQMPLKALAGYRAMFGPQATPELVVDDRGGDSTPRRQKLALAGVKAIGIQPKGKRPWLVAEAVRDQIRSECGQTEGVIGTLKSNRYKFNKPKERLWQTLEMAGPSSILSFNLNKFMRDLVELTK